MRLFKLIGWRGKGRGKNTGADLVFPFNEYLYAMPDFPDDVTAGAIRRDYPEGEVRLCAFRKACGQYPKRADLWFGLVRARIEQSLYDSTEYAECIETLENARNLETSGRTRGSIDKLLVKLVTGREQLIAEFGTDEPRRDIAASKSPKDRARETVARLEVLKKEVQPKGLLGAGPRDRELWYAYQTAISDLFQNRQPEEALSLLDEYHRRRVDLGLTPIPDYNLQEFIIGYLLQRSVRRARRTVKFWLANSKMPTIRDTIKHHPDIQSLFGGAA
jgi:hypothetical protein